MTFPDRGPALATVSPVEISTAARVIRAGGIVAFPTETFYGLAADPFNSEALERLFRLKGRDRGKALLVLLDRIESLSLLVSMVPELYGPLMSRFWPGPLTLVFPARTGLPFLLTGRTTTVGVRLSSHPAARQLAGAAGGVITGTSANASGLAAAVTAAQVAAMFPTGIDHIIDGGPVPGGEASAIVGQENNRIKLIRPGRISFAEISTALAGK